MSDSNIRRLPPGISVRATPRGQTLERTTHPTKSPIDGKFDVDGMSDSNIQ